MWASPLVLAVIAALAALVLRRRRLAFAVSALVLLIAVAAMTPIAANALLRPLENGAADGACDAPMIVVLSGGVVRAPAGPEDVDALGLASHRRLRSAIVHWREHPGSELILAGGGGFDPPEAELLARLARELGVPAAAVRTEVESATTWEAAQAHRARFGAAPIVLVTSAWHVPRARFAYAQAGIETCVVAADRRAVGARGFGAFLPQRSALEKAELALHEWVGIGVYRWRAARSGATPMEARESPARRASSGS